MAVTATAVLVFLLAIPGVWARSTYGAQVSVDEPQYLMTALSVAHDLDLDVSDEIADESFRTFHEIPLNTQTRPIDDAGRRFSPHDPLLPLILAPAMAFAPDGPGLDPAADDGVRGWVAARVTMALIAALTAAVTCWFAAARAGVRPTIAAAVVTLAFAGVPLAPYATQVYPEMPAALATMNVLAVLAVPGGLANRHVIVALLGIVALPWLAVKYAPVAVVLAGWLAWRLLTGTRPPGRPMTTHGSAGLRSRVEPLLAPGLALAASGLLYLVIHQRIYGGWTVYAAGDHFAETGEFSVTGTSPDLVGRSRRLVGLLADRSFGLIPWQPLWLMVPFALFAWLRNRRPWIVPCMLTLLAGYLTATFVALTMHGWWSPGRQIVVVAPIAIIAVARLAEQSRLALRIALGLGALGVVNWLWLAWESNTGRRTIVVDFAETAAWPYRIVRRLFPDALTDDRVWLTVPWTVVIVASVLWGVRGSLDDRSPRRSDDPGPRSTG